MLRNPPLVAASPDGGWVVLDGANRTAALRAAGARDVVVQQVDYRRRDIGLAAWRHAIPGTPPEPAAVYRKLEAALRVPFKWAEIEFARDQLRARRILAWVWVGGPTLLIPRAGSAAGDAERLRRLVATYAGGASGAIHRVLSDDPAAVAYSFPDLAMLVVFAAFEKEEVLTMARRNVRLPAGVTRHTIPGRALHVNVPLSLLASPASTTEKTAWLEAWLRDRIARNGVRVYDEPTVVFDE